MWLVTPANRVRVTRVKWHDNDDDDDFHHGRQGDGGLSSRRRDVFSLRNTDFSPF